MALEEEEEDDNFIRWANIKSPLINWQLRDGNFSVKWRFLDSLLFDCFFANHFVSHTFKLPTVCLINDDDEDDDVTQ